MLGLLSYAVLRIDCAYPTIPPPSGNRSTCKKRAYFHFQGELFLAEGERNAVPGIGGVGNVDASDGRRSVLPRASDE